MGDILQTASSSIAYVQGAHRYALHARYVVRHVVSDAARSCIPNRAAQGYVSATHSDADSPSVGAERALDCVMHIVMKVTAGLRGLVITWLFPVGLVAIVVTAAVFGPGAIPFI